MARSMIKDDEKDWHCLLAFKLHLYPIPCQQHLEFPSSLPSWYYPDSILLNFSVRKGSGVYKLALPLAH